MYDVNVGDVIAGKYRVDGMLGVGGMGMVVAATHVHLGQRVAIKLMLPTRDRDAIARFEHEAQIVARMRSPHVCRVFDLGTHLDRPFMVLELLEGHDLAQLLARQSRLVEEELVACIVQLLDALAEVHAQGVVHRDLKPSNIFVAATPDGMATIKLLDFGVAKANTSMTRAGMAIGTPAYMAPEQMQSARSVDPRADLWAVGVIAYEALTGTNPFAAATIPAMVIRAMQYEPPAIPGRLGAVVMRCLAKQPESRFASAGELAHALAPFGSPATSQLARKIARGSGSHAVVHPTTLQGAAVSIAGAPHAPLRKKHLVGAAALAIATGLAIALAVPRSAAPANPAPVVMTATAPVVAPIAATPAKPQLAVDAISSAAPLALTVPHAVKPLVRKTAAPIREVLEVSTPKHIDRALLDPSLPESLTADMVGSALADADPALRACAINLAMHSTVGIYAAIAPTGEVASINARTPHAALSGCIESAIREIPFTRTSTGGFFHRELAL